MRAPLQSTDSHGDDGEEGLRGVGGEEDTFDYGLKDLSVVRLTDLSAEERCCAATFI